MTQLASMGGDTAADFDSGPGGETVAPQAYSLGDVDGPLDADTLRRLDAWWRAANDLAVGQI
jgi:xylulose-5-phosphate/fructose-6-phosphate phosphoketolase